MDSTHPTSMSMMPFSITSSSRDYTNDAESSDHLLKQDSETNRNHSSSHIYHKEKEKTSVGCTLCLYWKTSFIFLYKRLGTLYTHLRLLSQTNIYFVVFATFFLSICFGIIFYSNWHDWQISTSFYYSSQVLLGNMYGIPVEMDSFSQVFTMIFFLWGTALIATFHLVATSNEFLHLQRLSNLLPVPLATPLSSLDMTDGSRTNSRFLERNWKWLFESIRSNFQSSYITAVCSVIWVILGTLFGVFYEKWTVAESLYFAVGAMSAAGIPNPSCSNGDDEFPLATCQLGPFRGCALGVYLIVGVPLFAFTIGHVAGYLVFSVTNYSRQKIFLRRQQLVREGKAQIRYPILIPDAKVNQVATYKNEITNQVSSVSQSLAVSRPHGVKEEIYNDKVPNKRIKILPTETGATTVNESSSQLLWKPDELNDTISSFVVGTSSSSSSSSGVSKKQNSSKSKSPRDDGTFAYESFEKFQFLLESSDDINAYFLRELLVTRKVQLADVQQIYMSLCQSAAVCLSAELEMHSSSITRDNVSEHSARDNQGLFDRDIEGSFSDEEGLLSPGREGVSDVRTRRSHLLSCKSSSTTRVIFIVFALFIFLLVSWSYKETFI